ncbi:acetyltransferase, GNAT family [Gottschalkia acidurici 9a]|uniref:Acetyltransferase, GNAT family n=1 Tax=Gottschalkia acidurici (strain ATCC 7906 / DSM 604 / BCRC 14475 / CIP 104303 / KCTC 5404 / NCIMB 10678 / 9a) TaxID=1128398 RepID=K0B0M3_GOTA9|nr:GNAT family N-acetyltransferase [Gottschalkia acidurici]AFS78455.1 acetyltransferase, GNAT family [Gottschalkia acidurici 9a]
MSDIVVKKLNSGDEIPYGLLMLADPSTESIDDYIHRGDCYAAYIDNIIVGAYVIIKTRPLTIELVNIAVSEIYQSKGIGKKLILDAIDKAKKENAKIIEVGTGNSSIIQITLYQKCGFRIDGIDKDYFKQHYKDKIIENGIECIDMIRLRKYL